ncbi:replication-relaxation family protein [Nocardiopsis lambiniae]|uniref:Replication-relaxation family protein n=1 Tax=Nocardiopsis lambiniae TaxID=3075539 RepID=A0ABU2MED3_9ACTN|nr:replication-relaxation family protein [Nocardiopsis sp. DSM 44743]MDT0330895.1 replication-relaxation family protein [Nocardiopsis sp. DSM 44743]
MTRDNVADLLLYLSERDRSILDSLRELRLLTTTQLRRLHFHHQEDDTSDNEEESGRKKGHTTEAAAAVAAMRVMGRLEARGLVARLMRRIGGVRAGSASIVWQLGAAGERFLRVLYGEDKRRRYSEPSSTLFIDHTLAVAEAAVRLRELERDDALEVVGLEPEPKSWRSFMAPHGARSWLKPDLFAITASGEFEDHWFIEVDRATEHLGVVLRKAHVYQRYAATGAHQAEHGLFPAMLWVVPDAKRRQALHDALTTERGLQADMFRVITEEQLTDAMVGSATSIDKGEREKK